MSFLLPLFFGLILFGVISLGVGLPSRSLRSKFVSMGTLKGKTKSAIVAVAGPPRASTALKDGKTLLQWLATGYHIRLVFNGEICEGVNHEHWRGY